MKSPRKNLFNWGEGSDSEMEPGGLRPMETPEEKEASITWKVSYRVFCLRIDSQREDLEKIMTECVNGTLFLLKEESHFTKEGEYLVALKWAEEDSEKQETENAGADLSE